MEMAHHATVKVHVLSSIETEDWVYVRTDAVRPPLVRLYNGPYRVIEKLAKFFRLMKNGKPDNVSIDRLKPAFIFDQNTSEETPETTEEITQPPVEIVQDPETSEVFTATDKVTVRDYRAALLSDPPGSGSNKSRPKRTYVKSKNKCRTESVPTKYGIISRPPSRL